MDSKLNISDDGQEVDNSLLALKKGTSSDIRIKTFERYYTEGILNLRPSYQRNEVINRSKASGIIESAILGIPLPPIYIFQDKEGNYEVIDGQQRLISFLGFLNVLDESKIKTKLNGFKLTGLNILSNLNGRITQSEPFKIFLNAKIRDFTIKTILFEEEKDFAPELKYEIFERLNKNPYPIKPNSFELWNCIYLSDYSRMIKAIAQEDIFLSVIARKKSWDKDFRMDNETDILRFLVISEKYHEIKEKKDISKKHFHNSIEKHFKNQTQKKELEPIKKSFIDTLKKIQLIFGNDLAKTANPEKPNLNLTLLDIIIIIFKDENSKFLQKYSDEILDCFKAFFSDNENRAIIQNSKKGKYKSAYSLQDRVEFLKSKTFDYIRDKYQISETKRQNIRDPSLKERLLKAQKNKCPYCKNIIKSSDKIHIDHWQSIDEFGGNEEENLAALHEQCNLEKSNKIVIN